MNENKEPEQPQEKARSCGSAVERLVMPDFELWLKTVCFKAPTDEAYDLAKSAWKEALAKKYEQVLLDDLTWYWVELLGEKCPALYRKNVDCFYSVSFGGIPTRQLTVLRKA